MKYIEGFSRKQMILYPERLDDLVLEDNPVRFIDKFVELLDLDEIGFAKATLSPTSAGRPPYSPEALLKLYIYGYFNKIRSSRKLMKACINNTEVMWLLGRLTPDFRTISDFRKDNAAVIKDVFKTFTKVCVEFGLYNREAGVQDGSKFRAVNSKDNNVTENKLQKKLERVEEKIEKYLEEMDKYDKEEVDSQKYTKEEMNKKLEQLQEQKERYIILQKEMKEEGVTQKSFTDPESRLMKTANGGFDVCYNTQIIVDPVSHLIGAFEVTNHCNDMGLLSEVAISAKEELGVDVMDTTADKGYEDHEDLLKCLMNGIIPHVPQKTGKESYEFELEYNEIIITEELLNSTKPEDIKACFEAGVIPEAYKGKGIEVLVVDEEDCVSDIEVLQDDGEGCASDIEALLDDNEDCVSDIEVLLDDNEDCVSDIEVLLDDNEDCISDIEVLLDDSEDCASDIKVFLEDSGDCASDIKVLLEYGEECVAGIDNSQQYFILNEEGTAVICPNGSTLNMVARLHNKGKTRFAKRSACRECITKCTNSKFKQVDLKDGQNILFTRKFRKKKVIIIFTPDKEKIYNRKCVVEHPFGTVKRWNDGSYLLLKGKEKVGAEFALSFLAYNMKRVINMIGVQELIEKMQELKGLGFSFFFKLFLPQKNPPPLSVCNRLWVMFSG